jgi:hypothetical protein
MVEGLPVSNTIAPVAPFSGSTIISLDENGAQAAVFSLSHSF